MTLLYLVCIPPYLKPGVLRPALIFCTRKGTPRRQLRDVQTLKIWPPCQEEKKSNAKRPENRPGLAPIATRTHPFHDAPIYFYPLPSHDGRPGRWLTDSELPQQEEETTLQVTPLQVLQLETTESQRR